MHLFINPYFFLPKQSGKRQFGKGREEEKSTILTIFLEKVVLQAREAGKRSNKMYK